MTNDPLRVTIEELKRAGVDYDVSSNRHAHFKIRWQLPGKPPRFVMCSCSPSDRNAWRQARRQVLRLLQLDK